MHAQPLGSLGTFPGPFCFAQTDLSNDTELAVVEAEIRGINAEAGITRCQRCEIDLSRILNTGLYSASAQPAAGREPPSSSGEGQQAASQQAITPGGAHGGGHTPQQQAEQQGQQAAPACSSGGEGESCGDPHCSDPHHNHHTQLEGSVHDARVGTVTIHLPDAALDFARLRRWLDALLWEGTAEAADLFRIKGLLHVAGSQRKHILQGRRTRSEARTTGEWAAGMGLALLWLRGTHRTPRIHAARRLADRAVEGAFVPVVVSLPHPPSRLSRPPSLAAGVHEIYDIVEGPEWAAGEPRTSKLVFIGRRLRRDALAADLAACLAEQ